jgi:cellulose synthase/poly-beta-1,6-N-acetylglucosamine synthase-like glycosyltransferase/peptidoglycan/xylan/chitin deacetylase (PgdA/CDA1 family)
MRLTVSVPLFDPAYDIEYIGSVSDAVMIMTYDEHFPASQPGPIASREWFFEAVTEMKQRLPADRIVVVLGAYGYDWQIDPKDGPGVGIGFRDVTQLAQASGSKPIFEENIEAGHFAYKDAAGATHDVWFQDALMIWNQVHILRDNKITRMGIWRLGTEDQTLWSFFGFDNLPERPDKLISLPPPSRSFEFYGNGEVMTVRGEPQSGVRTMEVDPSGRIKRADYLRVPTGYLVERRSGNPRQLVLSFDDGPSEPYTGELLDTLKKLKAPALFFLVGQQIIRFPDLVDRMVADGHLIGNHTYSHPHLGDLTPREAEIELNTNQRLIEGFTGRRTPLFRSPYEADVNDIDEKMFSALQPGLQAGYMVVGSNLASHDWTLPGVDEITKSMIDRVVRGEGQILLFHDGGGDRSQTVEAVKRVVPELRKRGYEFVSLDKFLNVPREELEQPLPIVERIISEGTALLAFVRAWGWVLLTGLFLACTVLAILRILFLGSLTIKDLRRKEPYPPDNFQPLVTVLVPAYNEEKVIAHTIQSLLESEYANIEVLVVDDGSKDRTAAIVAALAAEIPRVRLVRQANAGKATAANHGLREARGEIIVAVDADTIISPESIPKLVRHFYDPKITAVCGNVEVGNVKGFLTTFQAIEYVTSQNFDRRAFSALNCISVVPGALGAWRREAVLAAGGYSPDTLTEDADLTLTILRRGGRVVYEPEASGRTEAPENLAALLRQRFRWTFGTYQCLWKHREAFFHGSLGWIGLPNMVLFQILFPTLSPLGDVLMVLAVINGNWSAFLSGYVTFLAMDVCGSLLAFTLDKKPLKWLLLLIIQRFSYRQIMYYVSLKAMVAAIRGRRHSWRKIDRTGSVVYRPNPDSTSPLIDSADST